MGNFNLDIKFKQTTSDRIMCRICKNKVNGEDGYIKINLSSQNNYWNYSEKRIPICNDCFNKFLNKITIAKANKKESYKKLVKTKIIKSL